MPAGVLFGPTKDTLQMQKCKQSKINTVKNKKSERPAASFIVPELQGIVRLGDCIFPLK